MLWEMFEKFISMLASLVLSVSGFFGFVAHSPQISHNSMPTTTLTSTVTTTNSHEASYSKRYKIIDNKVYFYPWRIFYDESGMEDQRYNSIENAKEVIGADAVTFLESKDNMEDGYAKDKNKVYYNGEILTNADADSFAQINDRSGYAKDKNNIFLHGKILNIEIDRASLVIMFGAIKDSRHVYIEDYDGNLDLASDIDAPTFQHVGTSCEVIRSSDIEYYKDKYRVYVVAANTNDGPNYKSIDSVDVSSFHILQTGSLSNASYAKDKNVVYSSCYGNILKEADPATFQILGKKYARDKSHMYYRDRIINGADMSTFVIISGTRDEWDQRMESFSKDKNNVYQFGEKVEGVNPENCTTEATGFREACNPNELGGYF